MTTYKCSICGSSAKNSRTFEKTSHLNSRKHQIALGNEGATSIGLSTTKGTDDLTSRIAALEDQNKMIFQRLLNLEHIVLNTNSISRDRNLNKNIKNWLANNVKRGQIINIDTIVSKFDKQHWPSIEIVLTELVDDELFDVSESNSMYKIQGRYGILIKR